ncbi:hypothetical protein FOMPIDRAFT_1127707 [Fomitopsis schrenkii]|uniref:DUF6533 domain-containing protein n=1 Tax=Fomitopsis schrenkii TaxID=2126942 RepID=S8E399_FOMSC|nr:hypothetical protein FOMPIDRAFT_1127707 [Fomitopsis schrenkii]
MTNLLDVLAEAEFRLNAFVIASLSLTLYDHCLTFGMEVEYFWSGAWSLSRVLFLIVRVQRLLTVHLIMLKYIILFHAEVRHGVRAFSISSCHTAAPTFFESRIVVLRVWYILSYRWMGRTFVVISFLVTLAVTARELVFIYPGFTPIGGLSYIPCMPPPPFRFWRLYVPDLVVQTIVFGATLWPAVQLWLNGRRSQLLNRIVRDGGIFYVAVFTATAFTAISLLKKDNFPPHILTSFRHSFFLAISCISVSRLMLSIRSLAAQLSIPMDHDMLLSTAELSRVRWRRGKHDRELIVDIDTVEGVRMGISDGLLGSPGGPAVHMSAVGRYAPSDLELLDDI